MVIRLDQRMFKLLLDLLVKDYKLHAQEGVSAEQKLMVFMVKCGGGLTGRSNERLLPGGKHPCFGV